MLRGIRLGKKFAMYAALVTVAMVGVGCQDHLKTERDALYAENQELRDELSNTRMALEGAESDRARLVEQVAEAQENAANSGFSDIDGVSVEAGAGYIAVRVPGDILFDAGKVAVRSGAESTLNQIADVLQSEYDGRSVRVEGYTDTDPIRQSKWTDNLELSAHRAMSVQRHLAKRGIPTDRMYSAGFGEAKPRGTKAESRRVEIVVVMTPDA
ncbi:MAG: OmpA family protein [Phycisphaeraceae bacterium]